MEQQVRRLGCTVTQCPQRTFREQVRAMAAKGAEAVAAANPGCALQITAHTARLGRELAVYHPMELLAQSIGED